MITVHLSYTVIMNEKITKSCNGLIQIFSVRGFSRALKMRGLYPKGLITRRAKGFSNSLRLKLINSSSYQPINSHDVYFGSILVRWMSLDTQ